MTIRVMSRGDLGTALSWAAAEGWNPGLADAACFAAADADGFLMGFVDGKPVASISVVRYGAAFGFLGLYIVTPERRGQGFGYALWQAGLAHLRGASVGLDGVLAQQENYRRSGFQLAHRNLRYSGKPAVAAPQDTRLRAFASALLPALARCDERYFGARRPAFLAAWLGAPGHRAAILVEDGAVTGYGVVRPCRAGAKIGPLFAASAADAEAIFCALAADAEGPIVLDVPEPNRAAIALAGRHGLTPDFETARMYRGPAPALPLDAIFGITTFELG